MRIERRCLAVLPLLLSSIASVPAAAGLYKFINIADTTTTAPNGNYLSFGSLPTVYQSGVAFSGTYAGGSGIFSGIGGHLTTIAKTGDVAPNGVFTSFGDPAGLNKVSFVGSYSGGSGIFLGNGGPLMTVVKTGDAAPTGSFTSFGNPAMERTSVNPALDPDTTAFHGTYTGGNGIFVASSGTITTIARSGDNSTIGPFTDFGDPAISVGSGAITAFGGSSDFSTGIFTKAGNVLTPVNAFGTGFGNPFILQSTIAFRANPGRSAEAIDLYANGTLSTLVAAGQAAPSGTFTSFGDPVLTFLGGAFQANYGASQSGIFAFIGPGFGSQVGPIFPIIKTGDVLFGAHVVSVSMGRFGGQSDPGGLEARSPAGFFAFSYLLDDGRQGIAFAVPEPTSLAMALLATSVGACLARSRTRRRK